MHQRGLVPPGSWQQQSTVPAPVPGTNALTSGFILLANTAAGEEGTVGTPSSCYYQATSTGNTCSLVTSVEPPLAASAARWHWRPGAGAVSWQSNKQTMHCGTTAPNCAVMLGPRMRRAAGRARPPPPHSPESRRAGSAATNHTGTSSGHDTRQ